MNRWTWRFLALTILLVSLAVSSASAIAATKNEISSLLQKLESGQAITRSELNLAREINLVAPYTIDLRIAEENFKNGGGLPHYTRPNRPSLDEYFISEIDYDWFDVSEIGTEIILGDDDQTTITIPFSFSFFDEPFTSATLASNGYLAFGESPFSDLSPDPFPNTNTPNGIIGMFWTDLDPNSGSNGQIYTYHDDANDRFVIQFQDVEHFPSGNPETFELFLYTNGNIVLQYQSVSNASSCGVGIENLDGTEGVQACFQASGPFCPANELAIIINQADGVPMPVTDLAAAVDDDVVTLTWTDPTEDTNGNLLTPDSLEVWLGQAGTGILLASLLPGVETFIYTDAPDGNLTFSVRAFADPYYGSSATVSAVVGNPSYVDDFEIADDLWVSDNGWERGTPSGDGPGGAHGGDNCWGTVISGTYPNNACFNLTFSPELSINSPSATVEFWAWYDIETGWDGCNFKVSVDEGVTWEIVEPEDGYPGNTNTANGCNPSETTWTGFEGNSWHYVVIPIGQFEGQVAQFRFVFGSDGSVMYPGYYFDDMIIWGLADPVGADISGTVTLDGGAGDVTAVQVRANGLGNPTTNPVVNGDYTLANVLVGNRTVSAQLSEYHDAAVDVVLTEGGLTDVDLVLVRLDPPAPTGLEGSVNEATGDVTLTWDNSTDALVDAYNVYRRLQGEPDWVLTGTSPTNNYVDALEPTPGSGVFEYVVTAVDNDVTTPVESDYSDAVTVIYGEIPPTGLLADGDHDDSIILQWFPPGTPPEFELFYDDGGDSDVDGIGWWGGLPSFGWMVAKFQTTGGPATITRLKVKFTDFATEGDLVQYAVFEDAGGIPTTTPLGVADRNQGPPFNEFIEVELSEPVTIASGVFYIGIRQTTSNSLAVAGDQNTPFINNTFYYNFAGDEWVSYEPGLLTIPMIRCFAIGQFDQLIELTPAPLEVDEMAPTPVEENGKIYDVYTAPAGMPTVSLDFDYNYSDIVDRASNAVAPHAPNLAISRSDRRHNNSSLDENYIVYRDGEMIGEPTDEFFEDTGRIENVIYHYYVTAFYDNGEESGPTPTVDAMCNMEPAPPTGLAGEGSGDESVLLTWNDPAVNRDGSPCVDAAEIHVYRDGDFVTSIAAGVEQFLDTPPNGAGTYTYSLEASDEVPNVSEMTPGLFTAVGNPSYINGFEFDDGLWISDNGWERGTPTGGGPGGAYNGSNVWGTVLDGNYPNGACFNLSLAPELAVASPSATVEFWAWYDTESSWDGCNFKVSIDGGVTWEVVEPNGGYPGSTNTANGCNPGEMAWTGHGQGFWEYIIIPIGQYVGEVPQFKFVFGSDGSVTYPGFYFDDLIIWGLADPITAIVTGTVTLDGGNGNIESVDVTANGLGQPLASPANDGSYILEDVLVGDRTIRAMLTGYQTAIGQLNVTEAGPNVMDLTLVRNPPPVPTGLAGTVNNMSGLVTLSWDNTTDPLVDSYNIYNRIHNTDEWVYAASSVAPSGAYNLTVDGVWEICVTAVDEDASSPVESDYSDFITVLYGNLPPTSLSVDGNFDDKMVLTWLPPGVDPGAQLSYDDNSAEMFVQLQAPNGNQDLAAVRFTSPAASEITYPIEVNAVAAFMQSEGVIDQIMICPDNFGVPDQSSPFAAFDYALIESGPGWAILNSEGTVVLNEPLDFWVVYQLPAGQTDAGIGFDINDSQGRSSWQDESHFVWNPEVEGNYMIRAWVRPIAALEQSRGGRMIANGGTDARSAASLPQKNYLASRTQHSTASTTKADALLRHDTVRKMVASGKAELKSAAHGGTPLDKFANNSRGVEITHIEAPRISWQPPRQHNSLDELEYYIVYRDGSDIGHPTTPTFEDLNRVENQQHSYTVTSYYDNEEESPAAGPVTQACNMAPAAPTGMTGEALGNSQMVLSWTAPVQNADGSVLVDLTSYQIYRAGTMIGTVEAGVTTYTDTPPENDVPYSWTVRALDEVPNESADSPPFIGYVVSPWEVVDYEWVDISEVGTNSGISFDDHNVGPFELGFDFPYFGDTYSSVQICSNGWASFTSTGGQYFNVSIPNEAEPNNTLCPFWDDLYPPSGGQVLYWQDAANERFIISWLSVPHIGSTDELYTFQVVIGTDGSLIYNYHSISEGGNYGNTSCTVGVENASGTEGIEVCYDNTGSFIPTSETAIAFWAGPAAEIQGTIREFGTNIPIENAEITIEGLPDVITTATNGTYYFPVEPGTWTMTVHKLGYCDHTWEPIVLEDGDVVTRNATLLQPNGDFSATSLNLLVNENDVATAEFEISNPSAGCQFEYDITTDQPWLTVSPMSGEVMPNEVQMITATCDASGVPVGEYTGTILVMHNDVGGVFEIPVVMGVLDAEGPQNLPTEYAFHNAYPNPFNATTIFSFDLPKNSRVELVVYNMMGQEVARPLSENINAGRHKLSFSAKNLSSGMYIARLQAGSFTNAKKIMLLK